MMSAISYGSGSGSGDGAMKCTRHPKYKGARRPTTECETCSGIYFWAAAKRAAAEVAKWSPARKALAGAPSRMRVTYDPR